MIRSLRARLRAVDFSDVLTVASLALIGTGLASWNVGLALVVAGSLLALLTPVGAALRILVRGR